MPRGAHIDHTATALARLSKAIRDRRSFIAEGGRVFLEGKDVRRARARVFGRDEGECVDCGREVLFDDGWAPYLWAIMELSHQKPRSLGGDDSDANLATRCRPCHRKRDLHGCPGHF
jgi:5-methylcytosine-specific restriction endonuclease McrA